MWMSYRQKALVVATLLLTCTMLLVVPVVTGSMRPLFGFLSVLAIYWMCFCVPIAFLFGHGHIRVSWRLKTSECWVPVAALALPAGVSLVAKPWIDMSSDPLVPGLAVICALINGPLEEMAWRRPFRANSGDSVRFELLGLGLFTLWHVPLYLSVGITFEYGVFGLLGGAFFAGVVWILMTRRTGSIGWPCVSHTLVNLAAFIPLFAANFAR